jgi:Rps23 Pro-64 3,4-dihydroxylase Tpa1-like proline 4-hydroxylase
MRFEIDGFGEVISFPGTAQVSGVRPERASITLQLNPTLDCCALAKDFQERGRVHIQSILDEQSANHLYHCLSHETRYRLCANIGGVARALADLSPQERQACTIAAWREVGAAGFQFLFDMHRLSLNGEPYPNANDRWARVVEFLNGREFLDFARAVTGLDAIAFADAQATCYRQGHFLTAHDDDTPGTKRLAAYVFGFTPVWRPEWGGLLEFLDTSSQVEAGYLPGFNSLKLFKVPKAHYVSAVAPFAPAPRYSITGWLRGR